MVLKRMRDMFVASVHEGLDKLENPKVMLNQYVRDMESDIAKAKQTIVKQHTIAFQFKKKYEEANEVAGKRKNQAQLAFDAGEEELAKKALTEMKYLEGKAAEHKASYEQASNQLAELKEQLATLETRLQDVKDKKQALIARANAAKAKEHMNATFDKIDSESAYREFLRIENRIEEMEIRADYSKSAQAGTESSRSEFAGEVEAEIEKMRELSLKKSDQTSHAANE
ncbi:MULTISPECIES: stress responsive protein LiaH [Bacillus]|uniref:stress responsive protein LiaH n=1 Tax=Bacillus TaxID=1386 RepID=UPI000FDA9C78|nr:MULTISPECIES: PspA/IM30 family protein [Bacillus]AZV50128.1 protein LiaH [Bacillus halotolerans]MCP9297465.1 PspA/IM30 family protein [Bacillus halotolerans]MCV0025982.1 PspA/IM30 family protein [Bacillus sp. XT-2]MEC3640772.1 PspA/IM30 family protein [Bacillus halotolerans]QDK66758.1 PspA/IM30 family protein [Bacillus halotolerans]